MRYFPASQTWAVLCALLVRPTWIPVAILTAGSPWHALDLWDDTAGDSWVTPGQPLYRGTAAQALASTDSKEEGRAMEPGGPND